MLYKELDIYFRERFEELLNKQTPDSYRVRTHNSLSIMEELLELIQGWQKYRIQMPETISLCINECISLIKNDKWIDFSSYDKNILISDLTEYNQKVQQTKDNRNEILGFSQRLIYTISKCLESNNQSYLTTLFTYILEEMNKEGDMDKDKCYVEEMKNFDMAISSLCTELLRIGYSKNHLYLKAAKLKTEKDSIKDLFDYLTIRKKSKYKVIYRINANKEVYNIKDIYGFYEDLDNIKESLKNNKGIITNANYFNKGNGVLFFQWDGEALDIYGAIKKSKEKLAYLLDELQIVIKPNAVKLSDKVLVITQAPIGYYSHLCNYNYQLDGEFKNNIDMSKRLKEVFDKILNNKFINEDVKERIKSAFRHLRFAQESADIELQFINYWIALEFIFSSPISNESTFARLKKHLTNVLSYSYLKRNVDYLYDLLRNDKAVKDDPSLCLDYNNWSVLIDSIKDKRTQYRLCKMKSHLHNQESLNDYINSHETNLYQHISRIYRMRNELIHEAAIKQDIEGITSNLRFYLIHLLNQIVDFFNKADKGFILSLNDFFYEYENRIKVLKSNYNREYLMNVKYENNIIR